MKNTVSALWALCQCFFHSQNSVFCLPKPNIPSFNDSSFLENLLFVFPSIIRKMCISNNNSVNYDFLEFPRQLVSKHSFPFEHLFSQLLCIKALKTFRKAHIFQFSSRKTMRFSVSLVVFLFFITITITMAHSNAFKEKVISSLNFIKSCISELRQSDNVPFLGPLPIWSQHERPETAVLRDAAVWSRIQWSGDPSVHVPDGIGNFRGEVKWC